MSILIKDMEMPERCGQCFLRVGNCKQRIYMEQRPKGCPLIDIPTPHGRLGDLDALYEEISNGNKAYNGFEGYDGEYQHIGDVDDCLDVIKMEDTVIEAEGETDA